MVSIHGSYGHRHCSQTTTQNVAISQDQWGNDRLVLKSTGFICWFEIVDADIPLVWFAEFSQFWHVLALNSHKWAYTDIYIYIFYIYQHLQRGAFWVLKYDLFKGCFVNTPYRSCGNTWIIPSIYIYNLQNPFPQWKSTQEMKQSHDKMNNTNIILGGVNYDVIAHFLVAIPEHPWPLGATASGHRQLSFFSGPEEMPPTCIDSKQPKERTWKQWDVWL